METSAVAPCPKPTAKARSIKYKGKEIASPATASVLIKPA